MLSKLIGYFDNYSLIGDLILFKLLSWEKVNPFTSLEIYKPSEERSITSNSSSSSSQLSKYLLLNSDMNESNLQIYFKFHSVLKL